MAKFLSQVYTSIRGSVGGIVYTKNQFAGLIARAFSAPTNPMTNGQEVIRTAFSRASEEFQGLPVADRAAWDEYAATLVYQGPHGPYKLPGRQVFISNFGLALFLDSIGGSAISVAPAPPAIAGFENIGTVQTATYTPAGSTGISISIGNPNDYALVALVQRSIAWELTKNRYYGPWPFEADQAVDIAPSTSTIIDIPVPAQQSGKVIFTRVRCITASGPHRITSDFILRHIAETNE